MAPQGTSTPFVYSRPIEDLLQDEDSHRDSIVTATPLTNIPSVIDDQPAGVEPNSQDVAQYSEQVIPAESIPHVEKIACIATPCDSIISSFEGSSATQEPGRGELDSLSVEGFHPAPVVEQPSQRSDGFATTDDRCHNSLLADIPEDSNNDHPSTSAEECSIVPEKSTSPMKMDSIAHHTSKHGTPHVEDGEQAGEDLIHTPSPAVRSGNLSACTQASPSPSPSPAKIHLVIKRPLRMKGRRVAVSSLDPMQVWMRIHDEPLAPESSDEEPDILLLQQS